MINKTVIILLLDLMLSKKKTSIKKVKFHEIYRKTFLTKAF